MQTTLPRRILLAVPTKAYHHLAFRQPGGGGMLKVLFRVGGIAMIAVGVGAVYFGQALENVPGYVRYFFWIVGFAIAGGGWSLVRVPVASSAAPPKTGAES